MARIHQNLIAPRRQYLLWLFVMSVASLQLKGVDAFQLSMVSSSTRPTPSSMVNKLRQSSPFMPPIPFGASPLDISSSLISQLAVVALKARLADQTDVSCDVSSTSSDLLLRGRVGPVTVKGRGWRSGLGLTCRAIEATVDNCEIDMGRILSQRKLVLTKPATGTAMIAFNSLDFGNFITHPRMRPPSVASSSSESPIEFLKQDTIVDGKTGTITFFANFEGARWKCILQRGPADKRAAIEAVAVDGDVSEATGRVLTDSLFRFFNEMTFELDGTTLGFRDMMVANGRGDPNVMLALNIEVKKLPSRRVAF